MKMAYYASPLIKNGISRTDLIGTVFVLGKEYVARLSKSHQITHRRPSIMRGMFPAWKPYESQCTTDSGLAPIFDFDLASFFTSRRFKPTKDGLEVEVIGIKTGQKKSRNMAKTGMREQRATEDEGWMAELKMCPPNSKEGLIAYAPIPEGRQGERERKRVERAILKRRKVFEKHWGWIADTLVPNDHCKTLCEEVFEQPGKRASTTRMLISLQDCAKWNINTEFKDPLPPKLTFSYS